MRTSSAAAYDSELYDEFEGQIFILEIICREAVAAALGQMVTVNHRVQLQGHFRVHAPN